MAGNTAAALTALKAREKARLKAASTPPPTRAGESARLAHAGARAASRNVPAAPRGGDSNVGKPGKAPTVEKEMPTL
ncbi:hypothetical protein FOA52_015675 [Chlamydomonas sp. UWO 241]|nr:hypothetical protein FOA52_015675 [Chlamydomonas sp. UWO 241]